MNMRPQHITITSIKYLISYPINMKVSNQVFTTSNSNKCVGRARTLTITPNLDQPAPTGISQSKAKRVQEYVVAGRCLLMWLV